MVALACRNAGNASGSQKCKKGEPSLTTSRLFFESKVIPQPSPVVVRMGNSASLQGACVRGRVYYEIFSRMHDFALTFDHFVRVLL